MLFPRKTLFFFFLVFQRFLNTEALPDLHSRWCHQCVCWSQIPSAAFKTSKSVFIFWHKSQTTSISRLMCKFLRTFQPWFISLHPHSINVSMPWVGTVAFLYDKADPLSRSKSHWAEADLILTIFEWEKVAAVVTSLTWSSEESVSSRASFLTLHSLGREWRRNASCGRPNLQALCLGLFLCNSIMQPQWFGCSLRTKEKKQNKNRLKKTQKRSSKVPQIHYLASSCRKPALLGMQVFTHRLRDGKKQKKTQVVVELRQTLVFSAFLCFMLICLHRNNTLHAKTSRCCLTVRQTTCWGKAITKTTTVCGSTASFACLAEESESWIRTIRFSQTDLKPS